METKQNKKKHTPSDIKVYSLGGLGVVGMNMYILETNKELLIMDSGILFADGTINGVEYIIPDFSHLKKNEHKIVGLFITHGHEDHIGSLPFLLREVNIPMIYATGIAVGLIKNKMAEYPDISYNITNFDTDQIFKFKTFSVEFFKTNHSIPDSVGIAIKTRLGYIVNTGDFKFDFTPIGDKPDYYKMTRLGKEGVLCLLADSTNADIPNFSISEKKVGESLNNLFSHIEGRIIVATFASNVYRVQQILQASINSGRKVIVFGHSMEQTIDVATKLKYINVPKQFIYTSRELRKAKIDISSPDTTILCTGSQGEPMAALSRIASGTHKQIKLIPDDTIIYSSKPIPGNEQFINRNINKLVHAGAHIIKNSLLTDTHTTGHASQEEIRLMLTFMNPKYFMPAHGEVAMLKEHAKIAVSLGVKEENCFVLEQGDVLAFNEAGARVIKNGVTSGNVYLDSGFATVNASTIKERKKMGDDGMIYLNYTLNKSKKNIVHFDMQTVGFIDEESLSKLFNDIKQKAQDIFMNILTNTKKFNSQSVEKQLINSLNQYLYQRTERKPLLISSINILN